MFPRPMIAWARDFLPRRRPPVVRLRMPDRMILFSGCDRESIDATYDEGGRMIQLIVHTRSRSLGDGHTSIWRR